MDWMKWGAALLIGMMILVLLPRVSTMMKESRKAEPGEWRSVVIPLLLVVGFVLFLMASV